MVIQELHQQLLSLSTAEKAGIIQLLVGDLCGALTGIDRTPGVVGGDACIAGTRIPVWDLVQYRQMGASDLKILEAYPQITSMDLCHAWAYAQAFPEEIAQAISANEAA
jgi:uncharacterized protein (DUF433 family)